MKPLRVTFTMTTPMVIPGHPIHLDALLARVAVDNAHASPDTAFSEAIKAQETLPFQKWTHAEHTGYCASCLYLRQPDPAPAMRHMFTRPEIDLFAKARRNGHPVRKNHFPQGTGAYKLFALKIPVRRYAEAVAWCIGDPQAVLGLASQVPSIGKLARNQHGTVHSVKVEDDPKALQRWKRRNLPHGADTDNEVSYFPAAAAVFPPYWKRPNFIAALTPAGWAY